MAYEDARLAQALGAGGADIVLLQRLDQVGAQHAAIEARYRAMAKRDPGDAPGSGTSPRDPRSAACSRAAAPRRTARCRDSRLWVIRFMTSPSQIDRHGDADQPEDHQRAVDQAAAGRRGERGRSRRRRRPRGWRRPCTSESVTGAASNTCRHHLLAAIDEGGEVAGDEEPVHHERVLDRQRPIEPEVVAHRGRASPATALRPAMRAAGSEPGVAKKIRNTSTLMPNMTNSIWRQPVDDGAEHGGHGSGASRAGRARRARRRPGC